MPIIHQAPRRLAWLTALGSMLALVAAANVAAYPITPDGEPLNLDTGPARSSSVAPPVQPAPLGSGAALRSKTNAVPIAEIASKDTDRSSAIAVLAVASLAALALIAAAFVLTGRRRKSARAH